MRNHDQSPVSRYFAWLTREAIGGIVGGLALIAVLGLFAWLFVFVRTSVSIGIWLLFVLALLPFLTAVAFWWRYHRRQVESRRALDAAFSLIEVDDSLFNLLPILIRESARQSATQQVLTELLRDATRIFEGAVSRASILRPDARGQYLSQWVTYQMPPESKNRTKFYIGADQTKRRGVAGESFHDRRLRVVHFIKQDRQWVPEVFVREGEALVSDDNHYLNFEESRPYPAYRSFVSIPLLDRNGHCLGVLCFDSMEQTIFDPVKTHEILDALGKRVAAIMLAYQVSTSARRPS